MGWNGLAVGKRLAVNDLPDGRPACGGAPGPAVGSGRVLLRLSENRTTRRRSPKSPMARHRTAPGMRPRGQVVATVEPGGVTVLRAALRPA